MLVMYLKCSEFELHFFQKKYINTMCVIKTTFRTLTIHGMCTY